MKVIELLTFFVLIQGRKITPAKLCRKNRDLIAYNRLVNDIYHHKTTYNKEIIPLDNILAQIMASKSQNQRFREMLEKHLNMTG